MLKLLNRDIVFYNEEGGALKNPKFYPANADSKLAGYQGGEEIKVARWVLEHNRQAGATTKVYPDAKCLYLAIRVNEAIYGVIGIAVEGKPLDEFEHSILLSILGECALALENDKNAREKEETADVFLHRKNNFARTFFVQELSMIFVRLLHLSRGMQVIFCPMENPLMEKPRNDCTRISMMILCGLLIWWKIFCLLLDW